MSTVLSNKRNQCYNIEACRFWGGEKSGLMLGLQIHDGSVWTSIALPKKDAIAFCLDILTGLTELDK